MKKKIFPLLFVLSMTLLLAAVPRTTAKESVSAVWQTVSAGHGHTGAVDADGNLWLWGCNASGQLGNGGGGDRICDDGGGGVYACQTVPVKVMSDVVSVSASKGAQGEDTFSRFTAALQSDGSLWTWGLADLTGSGSGNTTYTLEGNTFGVQDTPVRILENVASVSAGGYCGVAVKTDGSLWAWGHFGFASSQYCAAPVKIMDGVVSASAGATCVAAVKSDGSLWMWGTDGGDWDWDGGGNGLGLSYTPVKVMDGVRTVSVGCAISSSAAATIAAIQTDDSLWMWGANRSGELGNGQTGGGSAVPTKVLENVASVCTNGSHTAAILKDGTLWMWGRNADGELGNGTATMVSTPVKILDGAAEVSCGWGYTAIKKTDGTIWTWGSAAYGALGLEGAAIDTDQATPEQVIFPAERVFYSDVAESAWYYAPVRALFDRGILPTAEAFMPEAPTTRLEFVQCLYQMHLAMGGDRATNTESPFTDMPTTQEGVSAVLWASEAGIVNGVSETAFAPDRAVTREQGCAFLMRFAKAEGLFLLKTVDFSLFKDSFRVSEFARSYVAACQMAGIVSGYGDGTFAPEREILHQDTAALLYKLCQKAAETGPYQEGREYVATSSDFYQSLYRNAYGFGVPVAASEAVPVSWFENAVFIGDSVSVRLQMYCSATRALGDAQFLCSTSLSATNALGKITEKSVHPSYNGTKMKVEDGVAACGAKNVYIMLGINSMREEVAEATQDLVTLIGKIQEKSPGVNILIQSVTPMTSTSTNLSQKMNNQKIDTYNARLLELCGENGWYYLDVASSFKDENGDLIPSYCSDAKSMGIHFTAAAAQIWVDYLMTHVPEPLK